MSRKQQHKTPARRGATPAAAEAAADPARPEPVDSRPPARPGAFARRVIVAFVVLAAWCALLLGAYAAGRPGA